MRSSLEPEEIFASRNGVLRSSGLLGLPAASRCSCGLSGGFIRAQASSRIAVSGIMGVTLTTCLCSESKKFDMDIFLRVRGTEQRISRVNHSHVQSP